MGLLEHAELIRNSFMHHSISVLLKLHTFPLATRNGIQIMSRSSTCKARVSFVHLRTACFIHPQEHFESFQLFPNSNVQVLKDMYGIRRSLNFEDHKMRRTLLRGKIVKPYSFIPEPTEWARSWSFNCSTYSDTATKLQTQVGYFPDRYVKFKRSQKLHRQIKFDL